MSYETVCSTPNKHGCNKNYFFFILFVSFPTFMYNNPLMIRYPITQQLRLKALSAYVYEPQKENTTTSQFTLTRNRVPKEIDILNE